MHPTTIEDATEEDTLDKLELYSEPAPYTFVVLHEPDPASSHVLVNSVAVSVVLTADAILTLHSMPVRCVGAVTRALQSQQDRPGSARLSNDRLLAALALAVSKEYEPLVQQILDEVKMIEELVMILTYQEQVRVVGWRLLCLTIVHRKMYCRG